MSIHPVWSNPEICSIVSSMMTAETPIREVADVVREKFGFRLNKNQIAGYHYRSRIAKGEKTPPPRPSRFEKLSPIINELADNGSSLKDIAAYTGKAQTHIRTYCDRHGITLAYSVDSAEARRHISQMRNASLRAQDAAGEATTASSEGVPFLERNYGCAWPLWEGRVPYEKKRVCGAETTEPGAPYCAHHRSLAYVGGSTRLDKEREFAFAANIIGKKINKCVMERVG